MYLYKVANCTCSSGVCAGGSKPGHLSASQREHSSKLCEVSGNGTWVPKFLVFFLGILPRDSRRDVRIASSPAIGHTPFVLGRDVVVPRIGRKRNS